MNKQEHAALTQPLSNDARVLYLLGLRPMADPQTGLIKALNNKRLLNLLSNPARTFTRGREINSLIRELVQVNLVQQTEQLDLTHSLNGKPVHLPLLASHSGGFEHLHLDWHGMTREWQPDEPLYRDLVNMVGVIEADYSEEELGDFKAYWLGQQQASFTPFQWTQKFVFYIKKQRTAFGRSAKVQQGTQWVTKTAALETDSNAKKLVEKYSGKS